MAVDSGMGNLLMVIDRRKKYEELLRGNLVYERNMA